MVAPFMPDGEKLAAVREALPAVGAGLYLDAAAAGPLPAETAAAMAEIADWELRVGRVGRERAAEVVGRLDEARAAVAAVLATELDAVRLAHGLGDALARAIRAIDWQPGDRLAWLADPADPAVPPSAAVPPMVETIPLADPGALDGAGRRVRLVVAPLLTATGARTPVEGFRAAARALDARLLVDASLAVGAVPVDLEGLGADLVVARTDAWLLGPQGLAVVVASHDLRDRVAEPAGPTFHLPSVVGLARSCGWLSMYVGLSWATDRIAELTRRAVDRIGAVDGLELVNPAPQAQRGPIVTTRIRGWTAEAALDELGRRVFLLAGIVPGVDGIRASIGWWNTADEIDRYVDGLALLASHTPATLPRRQPLAILGHDG